ncbi:hypothetical protein AB5N19_04523 [Seiridium cardinale]
MVGDFSRAYLTPGSRAQAIPKSQWTVQMSKTVYYHHHTLSVLFRQYRKQQIRSVDPPYMITKAEEHRLMRCVYIMEVLRLLLPTELRDDQAPGFPLSMFWMQLSPWENACVHWCTEHIAEATLLNRGTRQHLEALTETERIQGTRTLYSKFGAAGLLMWSGYWDVHQSRIEIQNSREFRANYTLAG